jgi:hypothetical protein
VYNQDGSLSFNLETLIDHYRTVMVILYEPGEDPTERIPEGWEVTEHEVPSYFKGLLNPGRLTCKPRRYQDPIEFHG